MIWLLVTQLWTGFSLQSGEILHGNWQSCKIDQTTYAEKIYEHTSTIGSKVVHDWDLHLGPYHDFAIYKRVDDPILSWLQSDEGDMPDHFHEDKNLLGNSHHVDPEYNRAKRTWTIPSLGLWINVVMAGGSQEDCESFVILIKKTGR